MFPFSLVTRVIPVQTDSAVPTVYQAVYSPFVKNVELDLIGDCEISMFWIVSQHFPLKNKNLPFLSPFEKQLFHNEDNKTRTTFFQNIYRPNNCLSISFQFFLLNLPTCTFPVYKNTVYFREIDFELIPSLTPGQATKIPLLVPIGCL